MLHELRLGLSSQVKTNGGRVQGDRYIKTYHAFGIPSPWSPFERKIKTTPRRRMLHEVDALEFLFARNVPVPRVVHVDYKNIAISLELVPDAIQLRTLLADDSISQDAKLTALEQAFRIQKQMHRLGVAHGDAYTKNTFGNRTWFAGDFEHKRDYPNPFAFDVRLLAGDSVYWLGKGSLPEVQRVIRSGYGPIQKVTPLPTEQFFFRGRFGISEEFLDSFYQK